MNKKGCHRKKLNKELLAHIECDICNYKSCFSFFFFYPIFYNYCEFITLEPKDFVFIVTATCFPIFFFFVNSVN